MKGKCLCGSVTLTTEDKQSFEACHCGMCRRWGGGPFMGFHCENGVQIEGAEFIQTFKSSDWAERGFCKQCGTHLYYKLIHANLYTLPIGLFQDLENLTFNEQIFIDKKPKFYSFAEPTTEMTEQEVFEKYAP